MKNPWEITPAFTMDRLLALARRLLEIRNTAYLSHDPSAGDGPWGFGCRVYERTLTLLERDVLEGKYPWLQVRRDGLYMVLSIDGWPIKVFAGDPEHPADRHVRSGCAEQEAAQLSLFPPGTLDDGEDHGPWAWLAVVQRDDEGLGYGVVFEQVNPRGEVRHAWFVSLDDAVRAVPVVVAIAREGVDLAPPPVDPKGGAAREETGTGGATADQVDGAPGTEDATDDTDGTDGGPAK